MSARLSEGSVEMTNNGAPCRQSKPHAASTRKHSSLHMKCSGFKGTTPSSAGFQRLSTLLYFRRMVSCTSKRVIHSAELKYVNRVSIFDPRMKTLNAVNAELFRLRCFCLSFTDRTPKSYEPTFTHPTGPRSQRTSACSRYRLTR